MLLLAMACLVAAMLLGGCGQRAERSQRITAVAWNIAADTLREQAAAFEKEHPDIKVDVQTVDEKYTRFMPRLTAGTDMPDVVVVQNRDFSTFLNRYPDGFLDLTDDYKGSKDHFVPASWDAVMKDGKIYAVPTDMGPSALFYRKDLFEKAGIDPASIETWDDLIAAGKKLQAATNGETQMLGTAHDTDLFDLLLNQVGGRYVTDDDKTVAIQDENGQKAATLFEKLIKEGTMRDVSDWDGRFVAMKRDQIAAVPYGVWFAGNISSTLPDQKGKWAIMKLPAVEKGGVRAANSGGSVIAIAKNTKHADAARVREVLRGHGRGRGHRAEARPVPGVHADLPEQRIPEARRVLRRAHLSDVRRNRQRDPAAPPRPDHARQRQGDARIHRSAAERR